MFKDDFHLIQQGYYFDRADVALKGISHYFMKSSDEEREHARKLMTYLNKRGGKIILEDIKTPPRQEWGTAEEAFQAALQLERDVNEVSDFFSSRKVFAKEIRNPF